MKWSGRSDSIHCRIGDDAASSMSHVRYRVTDVPLRRMVVSAIVLPHVLRIAETAVGSTRAMRMWFGNEGSVPQKPL